MRRFNVLLLSLLIFALPLQGIASVIEFKIPCPAETFGSVAMDAGDKHSCCNDADTVAKTGKLCKTQQNCQTSTLGFIELTQPLFAEAIGRKIPLFFDQLSQSFDPSASWRPPNLV